MGRFGNVEEGHGGRSAWVPGRLGGSWPRSWLLALACALLLAGCGGGPQGGGPQYAASPPPQAVPVYHLAVHPLHNPTYLTQTYRPLIDHLNARLQGAQLDLELSKDYAAFEGKYQARIPEFLLPNPWQTIQAMRVGYGVVAMAGDPADFRGLILVRRDSGIGQPSDLKGHAVSYPSPTALAACIMPQAFLHAHGVDVNADLENRYVGSQESSIMNVFLGKTRAGATWPPPWRAFQKAHPGEAAELRIAWETEPLINNAVMVRDDVPAGVRRQVTEQLVALTASAPGRALLAAIETAAFTPASDQDYAVVRSYIATFERDVRRVEAR